MADFDKTLFAAYANPRTTQLTSLLRSGILDPQMDWFETPKPTEIRPYMLGTLVYLVRIHAQLSSVAPSLLSRGITLLVDALAAEALRCFSTIKRFGMGGMLRATLEIEFLQQTLGSAVSGRAAAALAELYNKISKAYERRDKNENLQEHLDGVKKTLQEARRATGVEFLCFRTDKSASSSKSKEGEKKTDVTATPRKKESSSRTVATSGTRTPRKREERPANSNMI
jgi:exocyst complex component 2